MIYPQSGHKKTATRQSVSRQSLIVKEVKEVKVFNFESNEEFIQALGFTKQSCTEIKSKNMKKIVKP
jgi:hypothetical protein